MLIAHLADIHEDERDPRFGRLREVVDKAIDDAIDAGVDLFVFAGDLVGRDQNHKYSIRERLSWAMHLNKAGEYAPCVAIAGNHDERAELSIFNFTMPSGAAYPIMRQSWKDSLKPLGIKLRGNGGEAWVFPLPYLTKNDVLGTTAVGDIADQNEQALEAIYAELKAAVEKCPPGYRILVSHQPTLGVAIGPFEYESSQDICHDPKRLGKLGFDYIALGHIHERQRVAERTWYSGSIAPHRQGESNDKGYLIAELNGDGLSVHFRKIDSWTMDTIEVRIDGDATDIEKYLRICQDEFQFVGHQHVRLILEHRRGVTIPKSELEKAIVANGAASARVVSKIIDDGSTAETRMSAVAVKTNDEDALVAAMEERQVPEEQRKRVLGRFPEVRDEG